MKKKNNKSIWYDTLDQLTTTTKNHADNFNALYECVLSNTKYNKETNENLRNEVEELKTTITELKKIIKDA